MDENELSNKIVGAAIEVHRTERQVMILQNIFFTAKDAKNG